jgi:hypothetical protein
MIFARGADAAGVTGETATKSVKTVAVSLAINITAETISMRSANIKFVPESDVASFDIAIGTQKNADAFAAGTMSGIVTINNGEETTHLFEDLAVYNEYVVYARGVDKDGTKGAIATLPITTEEDPDGVAVRVKDISALMAEFTVIPGSNIVEWAAMLFVEGFRDDGTTEEDVMSFIQLYAMFGMADMGDNTPVDWIYALTGEPGVGYVYAFVVTKNDGTYAYYESQVMRAPEYDPSLPLPGDMTLTLLDVQENSAVTGIYMGENTIGYIMSMYTKEAYDAFEIEGDIIASLQTNGYMEVNDYPEGAWNLTSPDTDYILAAVPMNGNGIMGFGNITTLALKTLPSSEALPMPEIAPTRIWRETEQARHKAITINDAKRFKAIHAK